MLNQKFNWFCWVQFEQSAWRSLYYDTDEYCQYILSLSNEYNNRKHTNDQMRLRTSEIIFKLAFLSRLALTYCDRETTWRHSSATTNNMKAICWKSHKHLYYKSFQCFTRHKGHSHILPLSSTSLRPLHSRAAWHITTQSRMNKVVPIPSYGWNKTLWSLHEVKPTATKNVINTKRFGNLWVWKTMR